MFELMISRILLKIPILNLRLKTITYLLIRFLVSFYISFACLVFLALINSKLRANSAYLEFLQLYQTL